MYAKSADKQADITRTGSHSTKPFGGGRVDVLPVNAKPWEVVWNGLREQRDILAANITKIQEKIAVCNDDLKMTLPRNEFLHATRQREIFVKQLMDAQKQAESLRKDVDTARKASLGECFMDAARKMLTVEQYDAVLTSTREALADPSLLTEETRPKKESHLSDEEKRRSERDREARRDSRARMDPNHHRHARVVAKDAKYGGANATSARLVKGPDFVTVYKEF
jgi:hypothetical protein